MEMVRIRFLDRAVYDTNGPGRGPVYQKGSVHTVPRDQADRWLRRLLAEELPPEAAEQPTEEAPKGSDASPAADGGAHEPGTLPPATPIPQPARPAARRTGAA